MTLSLPLRINLISLVFTTLVASVLTALGGFFLYHQQVDNATSRAKLAADELTLRAHKLLDLELRLQDFIGFDTQCAAVIRNDALLREAAVFNGARNSQFHSQPGPMAWPAGAAVADAGAVQVLDAPGGSLVVRPILRGGSEVVGYAVVAVAGDAVLASTLRIVAWLVGCALALFALGLMLQQRIFWRTVGRPLATLVRTADGIQPDNLAPMPAMGGDCSGADDIGRLYCAFSRLMQRLQDARAQLLRHNEELEATVAERTLQLERVNADLARDIHRRQELEDELRQLASTDALTGLANRAFVLPYAQRRIEQARRQGQAFGLMLLDFDGFKAINDTHGHAAGDEVLRTLARRLQPLCRSADVLARLGGDEFLLAFEGCSEPAQAELLGRRLLAAFDEPVPMGPLRLKVGVSIGAALLPLHASDFDTLMAAADAAMYAVKQRGGGFGFAAQPMPAAAEAMPG